MGTRQERSPTRYLAGDLDPRPFPLKVVTTAASVVCMKFNDAELVMFSSAFAFVCLLTGLRKKYSPDFHKIQRTVGTRAADETVRFWR